MPCEETEAPSSSLLIFLVLHEETEAPFNSLVIFLVLHEETEAPSSSLLNSLVLHEEKEGSGSPIQLISEFLRAAQRKGSKRTSGRLWAKKLPKPTNTAKDKGLLGRPAEIRNSGPPGGEAPASSLLISLVLHEET